MLIVAIPKSASTSLLATLAHAHGLEPSQTKFRRHPRPEAYPVLAEFHSDVRLFKAADVARFTAPGTLYKQHIPPARTNIELFSDIPKVVLMRRPEEDIVLSYKRAEEHKIHAPKEDFAGCDTEEDWLARADEIELLRELQLFRSTWEQECGSHPSKHLLVYYDELTTDPSGTIARIEAFWGLPPSGVERLKQKRYSRRNPVLAFFDHHVRPVAKRLIRRARRTSHRTARLLS